MAVYEINGSRYEVPDDLQGDELTETLMYISELPTDETQDSPQDTPQDQPYQSSYGQVPEDIDPETLMGNEEWLSASREIYKMNEGRDWEGDPADLTEYGLDFMGFFNYNLPKMGIDAARINDAEQPQKEAFLYMMDTYDNLNMSWGGTGRFFKGVLTDPTTYIGLGTLGVGLVGKEGAKQLGKQGVKEALKQSLGRTGIVAGVEGGIYGAADDTIRQSVEISAGRKDEIDLGQTVQAVGFGAGAGLVGGTVIDAVATGVRRSLSLLKDNQKTPTTSQPPKDAPTSSPEGEPTVTPDETGVAPVRQSEGVPPQEAPEVDSPRISSDDPQLSTSREVEVWSPEASASREVGSEGAVRADVDDVIDNVRVDDIAPSRPLENPLPFVPRNMEEITQFAQDLGKTIKGLNYHQAEDIARELKETKMTQAEWGDFNRSTQVAVDNLRRELKDVTKEIHESRNPERLADLSNRQAELENLLEPVAMMDEAFSSLTGSMLRQRQEGLTNLRGLSPKKLMEAEGLTRAEAEVEYIRRVEAAEQSVAGQKAAREYDQKFDQALANGDTLEASRWATMKRMHMEALSGGDVRTIHKLNELVISNVFSATTLAINLVPSLGKTLYRPALNALLSNPLEAATRRELAATYSAMRMATGGAWRAAKAAFRYEQSILTRDSARLTEGELAITGKKAGYIRIFPRLLNASDEFLGRLTYNGFIAGDAASKAYEAGVQEGLKGKALDSFVKTRVKDAVDRSLSTGDDEAAFAVLLNKGVNLGLTGDKLTEYVQKEIARDPSALTHGTNEEAVNYVRDVLYKRAFSGTNGASKVAKGYEKIVNDVPSFRLMGQLFFRTPVRVFEEGIRMTPGVQIIAPGFLKDLSGKNGRRAQVRAQGEAMMSLAFTGTVLTLYSQGMITGDGAYSDWKQARARGDTDLPEPYTIRFADGSTWSYRNFDPIATPIKIMVNALERYEQLEIRKRQGEFIGKGTEDRVFAALSVASGAVATAIRDANLMAGIAAWSDAWDNVSDVEGSFDGAVIKFMGEKLRTLVPNTMHKIAKTNDPTIDDPKTFFQMVESRLLDGATLGALDKTSPKSYDVLGNVRQINDTGALWNIFSVATEEERQKGRTEVELDVLRKLDHISKQTDDSFVTPYTHKMLGNLDLRTQMTEDGKQTLYDRWNQYYRELQPEQGLSAILNAGLPVGTKEVSGATVKLVRRHMSELRDAAFTRLMAEETHVSQQVIQKALRDAEVKAGFWD